MIFSTSLKPYKPWGVQRLMQKQWLVLVWLFSANLVASAQWKKYYSLENNAQVERIDVNLKGTSGSCIIKPVQNMQPVSVYGSIKEQSGSNPVFTNHLKNGHQSLNINFETKEPSKSTSTFFYSSSKSDDVWKIYLSDSKPLALNLNYAIGGAKVDLSGLSIDKLKITTGSADVRVTYLSEQPNKIEMDTFLIKVELGTVQVDKMNYNRAQNVKAQVGFGKMVLDYSDQAPNSSKINASVGAGTLMVLLHENDLTPIVIYINESPLCHVRLTKNFKEVRKNVFVNSSYDPNAENLLTFNVDVSMGNIVFKTK